ncbi:MAG TPA: GTPase domain-containing protein [Paracoccus sp.]|nr:GTPase domain-containing protein [Paracoccus sp. (in: a-proteobacteria)]
MKDYLRKILGLGAQLDPPSQIELPLPTLWLLGNTGAGKSSLIRALTGEAEVGAGFAPCTRTARAFDYPAEHPVLRFLDTRGLGEAGYDPGEDLAAAEKGSHAVLVVMRLDDPAQASVAEALRRVRARRPKVPVLVVHTGADLVRDPGAQARARGQMQALIEAAAGGALPGVTLALPEDGAATGMEDLRTRLGEMLPGLSLLLMRERDWSEEAARFTTLRPTVLWYAGAAGASDAAPLVGTLSVPALQGAMLHALARRHGLEWTPARIALFASALGTGAIVHFAASHMLRQGVKLVPVYGQTLGAAAAAATSFAATYALGRAASAWLYRASRGEVLDGEDLRHLYDEAFRRARHADR